MFILLTERFNEVERADIEQGAKVALRRALTLGNFLPDGLGLVRPSLSEMIQGNLVLRVSLHKPK